MSAPKAPIHQDDGSGFEPPELPPEVLMKCNGICMDFERSWRKGEVTPIEGIRKLVEGRTQDERLWLLFYLLELELKYRTDAGHELIAAEYEAHFPQERDTIREAFRDFEKSGDAADPNAQTSTYNIQAHSKKGCTVTCPECDKQIETEELEPGVGKCQLCGSSFFLSTDPSKSGPPIILPQMIGHYRIIGPLPLGGGAFGTVYKAEDTRFRSAGASLVALKIPRDWNSYTAEGRERFFREADAAKSLGRHPHIVAVYDIGYLNGVPFLVCQYIDGCSLKEKVEREGPVSIEQAATIVGTIAGALAFAHKQDVTHRDVKPGNILVDRNSGEPYLADFGLARREGVDVTLTKDQILGTIAYMSPEQASGKNSDIGPRSDIFSLGIVLYELLTGTRPFQGDAHEILRQIVAEPPLPPRKRNPKIPKDLETVCLKCLEKTREQRYQTADELAADLQRVLEKEPVRARRVSPLERGWRWCRKNVVTTVLSVLLIATLSHIVFDRVTGTLIKLRKEQLDTINQLITKADNDLLKQVDIPPIGILNFEEHGMDKLVDIPLDPSEEDEDEKRLLEQHKNKLRDIWQENNSILLECLDSWFEEIRYEAINTIGRLSPDDPESIKKLSELESDSSESPRNRDSAESVLRVMR